MRDLAGLRELVENVARVLWALCPPQDLLGPLQRSLRNCYLAVQVSEHISGYLNKSFHGTNNYSNVLDFANAGQRTNFLDSDGEKRFRDIRKVISYFLRNLLFL